MKNEKSEVLKRAAVPREPGWPVDFTGVPTKTLRKYQKERPDCELIQHVPPGDGWHRAAWVRLDYPGVSAVDLFCECSLQQLLSPEGVTMSFSGNDNCSYLPVTAYLRALSLQDDFPQSTAESLRTMLDAALAGQWLGQFSGSGMWGSNLYLSTVSVILDVPMPWDLATEAIERGLISVDGAVLGLPRPVRTQPEGPVMDWDSTASSDGDWIVWWARLDSRYQVEVARDPARTSLATLTIYDHANFDAVIHTEAVVLGYGAIFGPDTDDVSKWKALATRIADEHGG